MKHGDICPNSECGYWLIQHENSDLVYCLNCGFDEQYNEVKAEVLYIIDFVFNYCSDQWFNTYFTCPNGSTWHYNDVQKFLKDNLK